MPPDSKNRFTGQLLRRGEEGFERAVLSRVFNHRRPDRHPAAVLLAADEADVAEGVRFAGEMGWQVSIRSGGHSWAAWSVRDDALLIDLGALVELSYDAATMIVTVSPAIKGGTTLAPFLAEHGRFFPGGHCPNVGLGGFLLQGGQGWDARGLGWAAEFVEAIDVVTATGALVRADQHTNADLFWAARGAGPAFPGIVTRFHLRTLPQPQHLAETVQVYGLDDFDDVMGWMQDNHHRFDPRVEIVAISAMPPIPIPGHGHVLAITGVALVDTPSEAAVALAPFTECPFIDRALMVLHAVPVGFDELRTRQTMANPEGHRYRVDNAWITGATAEVVPMIRRAYTELPTDQSFTIWFSMAPLRPLPDMAFDLQTEIYLSTYTVSNDPSLDGMVHQWVDEVMRELQPVTAGQYLGDSDFTNRQLRFMSDHHFDRLTEVRAMWDPDQRFVGYLAADPTTLNRNHWEPGSPSSA